MEIGYQEVLLVGTERIIFSGMEQCAPSRHIYYILIKNNKSGYPVIDMPQFMFQRMENSYFEICFRPIVFFASRVFFLQRTEWTVIRTHRQPMRMDEPNG